MSLPIAVLGADPIGASLAILLSKKGFNVEIFDKNGVTQSTQSST